MKIMFSFTFIHYNNNNECNVSHVNYNGDIFMIVNSNKLLFHFGVRQQTLGMYMKNF